MLLHLLEESEREGKLSHFPFLLPSLSLSYLIISSNDVRRMRDVNYMHTQTVSRGRGRGSEREISVCLISIKTSLHPPTPLGSDDWSCDYFHLRAVRMLAEQRTLLLSRFLFFGDFGALIMIGATERTVSQ
jgi:hypothetical protein